MIFVTVGTWQFDDLIKKVDLAVKEKYLDDNVLCQIGTGRYIPSYCQYYRVKPSIKQDIRNASFVISHGGATIFQLLKMKKQFLAIPNPAVADDHQEQLVEFLSKRKIIHSCSEVSNLVTCYKKARLITRKTVELPCLAGDLIRFIYDN